MRRWRVDVIYTVYVEHDEEEDVVGIATDWLDEEFTHGLSHIVTSVGVNELVSPVGGWATEGVGA